MDTVTILNSHVPRETQDQLWAYSSMVVEWNQRINLTGAKNLELFFNEQVSDCVFAFKALSESKFFLNLLNKFELNLSQNMSQNGRIENNLNQTNVNKNKDRQNDKICLNWLDIGSGCGLPGIVWSFLQANDRFMLLESLQKRVVFLEHVVLNLKINNISIENDRFETNFFEKYSKKHQLNSAKSSHPSDSFDHDLDNKSNRFNAWQPQNTICVSRGTAKPDKIFSWAQKTALFWKLWVVFSSKNTHQEFVELSKRGFSLSAREGFVEVEGIEYQNDLSQKTQGSVLTLLVSPYF